MLGTRAAGALAVGALALGGCGDAAGQEEPARAANPSPLRAGPAERAGAPHREAPVLLLLPSGTPVRVRPVGTRGSGLLDVPDDITEAGWWRGGARLGDPFGSTLVAGHVDARDQGLGAFAELLGTRPGETVRLSSHHLEQRFRVRALRLVPQDRVRSVLATSSVRGTRRLTLVTCAPPYLPDAGGYQNLAVVTAMPTGPVRARSAS